MTTADRYAMNPLDGPAVVAGRLWELERRIAALEGAPMVGANVTSRDGITDRAIFGKLDPAGAHYGARVPAPGGDYDAFYVDERGLDTPMMQVPSQFTPGGVAPYATISGGTFLQIATAPLEVVSWEAVRIRVGYQTSDGSTTIQLRVRTLQRAVGADPELSSTTDIAVGPAAAGGVARVLDWVHGLPLGTDDGNNWYFSIDGRVASGAGNLQAYQPVVTMMNSDHGGTAAGVWTAGA